MSPTGRKIHQYALSASNFFAPLRIGILETPTGFEVNAIHAWPERMEHYFAKTLQYYKPKITRIRAWNREEWVTSTQNPDVVDGIGDIDYLYAGAGSPVYVVRHLMNTRALDRIVEAHNKGMVLCTGSATAMALGSWVLPVYEIFKCGDTLGWQKGLGFFGRYGMNLVIIPHWNNREGEDFDTKRCFMGKNRFSKLADMLPRDATIVGIDEQTACVMDFSSDLGTVLGAGTLTIVKGNKVIRTILSGKNFSLEVLRK
jgi:cyanophycinase-like exopeptidase